MNINKLNFIDLFAGAGGMAEGFYQVAYTSWLGGAKEPIAMIALLDMLAMLDDEGIVRVVREQESNKVIGDKIL